jgi:hypothetical protein
MLLVHLRFCSDFEYIHPVIRIYPRDFPPKWLLSAKIIHLICAAARAREIVDEWHTLQQKYAEEFNMPKSDIPDTMFMWEPLPWDCIAEVCIERGERGPM